MGAHEQGADPDVPSRRPGSLEEYERLTAERERLIAAGVPADHLTVPLKPEVADAGRQISDAINADPTEVELLRNARRDAREMSPRCAP